MYRIRLFSSATRSTQMKKRTMTTWDPVKTLSLNHPTLLLLETKCKSRQHFKQILSQMMRLGLTSQTFPISRLIYFSAISHPENLDLALLLFHHFTLTPNLYIYNTLISALSSWKSRAFALYTSLFRSSLYPDVNTLLHLLRAANNRLSDGKRIHCHAIVLGLYSHGYLQNSLIGMYLANGQVGYAHKVFDEMPEPDLVSFNIMIVEHAKLGCGSKAIRIFLNLAKFGLEPDGFTMLGMLMCCGQMGLVQTGKSIHGWMERRSLLASNLILQNALLDMYMKCNQFELAQTVFKSMNEKDAVSWNTMIGGFAIAGKLELAESILDQMPVTDTVAWNSLIQEYAKKGDYVMAKRLLNRMQNENIEPDNVTLLNLVLAVTKVGAFSYGRCIHGFAIRKQMNHNSFLVSSLIDMYSKCGDIRSAFKVFEGVTETKRDIAIWTAMITGSAFHGHGSKALELFSNMQQFVTPNYVTFVAVLTACSHNGLVDQGLNIFNSMIDIYRIEPLIEHYACVVDLLGRSGRARDAFQVIQRMPMKPGRSIWGSLLSACRSPEDAEVAELASRELLRLDSDEEGGYMLLSNMYAASGKWERSDEIRAAMEDQGVKKTAGASSFSSS